MKLISVQLVNVAFEHNMIDLAKAVAHRVRLNALGKQLTPVPSPADHDFAPQAQLIGVLRAFDPDTRILDHDCAALQPGDRSNKLCEGLCHDQFDT